MTETITKEAAKSYVDSALSAVGSFEPSSLFKGYRALTGSPLGAAAVNATVAGIPSYFLARPIARALTTLKGKVKKMTPQQLKRELNKVDKSVTAHRWAFGGGMSLMALMATLAETYVPPDLSPDGGFKSWATWHPRPFTKANSLRKTAAYDATYNNALFDHPAVPVDYSMDLIWNDKYLDGKTKINALTPIANAGQGSSGLVSPKDIAKGAIRAGFGLGAGYLAGKTLGGIFMAPQAVTQTMSATGALAGAILNSGVF